GRVADQVEPALDPGIATARPRDREIDQRIVVERVLELLLGFALRAGDVDLVAERLEDLGRQLALLGLAVDDQSDGALQERGHAHPSRPRAPARGPAIGREVCLPARALRVILYSESARPPIGSRRAKPRARAEIDDLALRITPDPGWATPAPIVTAGRPRRRPSALTDRRR